MYCRWGATLNRTQALVLVFLVLACLSAVVITLVEPEILFARLPITADRTPLAEVVFLVALTAFIGLVGVGVVGRLRWTFWLLVVAFIAGALRVPAALLELNGLLPQSGPTWYVIVQGLIGVVQFALGVLMLVGYRRNGIWGAF